MSAEYEQFGGEATPEEARARRIATLAHKAAEEAGKKRPAATLIGDTRRLLERINTVEGLNDDGEVARFAEEQGWTPARLGRALTLGRSVVASEFSVAPDATDPAEDQTPAVHETASDLDDDDEHDDTAEDADEESDDDDGIFEEEAERVKSKRGVVTMSEDSVRMYLKQIGKTPLINAETEVELSKQIEAGLYAETLLLAYKEGSNLSYQGTRETPTKVKIPFDETVEYREHSAAQRRDLERVIRQGELAKQHMIEANLRLVVSLAKRYTGRGMPFLDLIQEGNLGLDRAVNKFDYKKGYKFSTYATWWIRQAITRAMADQARTIRIPVHMVEVINKMGRTERDMLQELGRKPTDDELAGALDITVKRLNEIRDYSREPISLDQEIGSDGDSDSRLGDFIEDGEAVQAVEAVTFTLLQDQIRDMLETLGHRERGVIEMRFGLVDGNPRTLDDIGKAYGVTRERIRQIEAKTMSKLRHPSRSQVLRDYLD